MGIVVAWPTVSQAQQSPAVPAAPAEDLAKQLANPISSLVSVPFQFNWEQNVGPKEATRFILNVQPVMPFALNKDWNLIMRVIVPLVSQPALTEGGTPAFGVSDVLTSFFFSPASGGLIWGVGPVDQPPFHCGRYLGDGEMERGADSGRVETDGAIHRRGTLESDLVLLRQHRARGRQPDVLPTVRRVSGVAHVDDHRSVRDDRELGS